MRLGFPSRVSPGKVFVFATATFAIQQVEHTDIAFSFLYFAFVILSMLAFNAAGGFTRVAGAWYAWFSLLVCIVGVTWKMVINEPGESNLIAPDLTMTCYVVTAAMFLVVASILKKVDLRRYEFGSAGRTATLNYSTAGLGCLLVSQAYNAAGLLFGVAPGGLLSALGQLNQFAPLGIMLATIGAINDSHGKRTMNFINGAGMLIGFSQGLAAFSKQGMLTPMACWIIALIYKRFELKRPQIIGIAVGVFLSFYVFSPLSQARDLIHEDWSYTERLEFGISSIIHIQQIREHISSFGDAPPSHSYFGSRQNALISRLNMIGIDDALIDYSSRAESLGFGPVADNFINFVPHFLAPNKPELLTGNFYAHEIGGLLADSDTGTGISFSPVAECFRLDHWIGLTVILPGIWLILFTLNEFICGDLKKAPWTLLPMLLYTHVAPEGLLSGQIYMIGFGNGAILLCVLVSTRLAPTLGKMFYGSSVSSTAIGAGASVVRPRSTASRRIATALP
jgi:hypothetical protein